MTFALVVLSGMLVAAGLVCLVVAVVPATPRLDIALSRISGQGRSAETAAVELEPAGSRSERLGALVYRHWPLPLTSRQKQNLKLQNKPIAEFFSDKMVMAVVGGVIPAVLVFCWGFITGSIPVYPAVVAVLGALIGFFVPDVLLLRATKSARTSASEALLVYIDLVTLERLANASATQALHSAASLSDVPIFAEIRSALERAQLEQQSPYAELRRLAEQLQLPELIDIADVMQMDETGAALSGALRARVKELRDAHLTREQMEASATAEGMTFYMTLPALIFGLIFMVPPLMKIVLG